MEDLPMRPIRWMYTAALLTGMGATVAGAGVVDPDCTAGKATKSAAMKATVGVGGRCDFEEAATDTGKRAAGVEEKGALEKHGNKNDDKRAVEKGASAAKNAVTH
jgi:hypothetical protein